MPCCWPKPRSHSASRVAAAAYPDGVAHDHNHERGPGAAEPRKCTAVHVRGRSPVTLKLGTSKFARHSCSPSTSVRCIWCSSDRKAASSRRPAKLMGPVMSWSPGSKQTVVGPPRRPRNRWKAAVQYFLVDRDEFLSRDVPMSRSYRPRCESEMSGIGT